MRTCSHCGKTKPLTDFYQYDGRPMSACKGCVKFRVRASRAAKVEYYREYDRRRAQNPDRVAQQKLRNEALKASPHKTEHYRRTSGGWQRRNAEKHKAHVMVGHAIRNGKLVKQPCERCKATEDIHAHHEDYAKPLDVNWLCKTCHGIRHREINAERRQAG